MRVDDVAINIYQASRVARHVIDKYF